MTDDTAETLCISQKIYDELNLQQIFSKLWFKIQKKMILARRDSVRILNISLRHSTDPIVKLIIWIASTESICFNDFIHIYISHNGY